MQNQKKLALDLQCRWIYELCHPTIQATANHGQHKYIDHDDNIDHLP
jgi:hypothetical protein